MLPSQPNQIFSIESLIFIIIIIFLCMFFWDFFWEKCRKTAQQAINFYKPQLEKKGGKKSTAVIILDLEKSWRKDRAICGEAVWLISLFHTSVPCSDALWCWMLTTPEKLQTLTVISWLMALSVRYERYRQQPQSFFFFFYSSWCFHITQDEDKTRRHTACPLHWYVFEGRVSLPDSPGLFDL